MNPQAKQIKLGYVVHTTVHLGGKDYRTLTSEVFRTMEEALEMERSERRRPGVVRAWVGRKEYVA